MSLLPIKSFDIQLLQEPNHTNIRTLFFLINKIHFFTFPCYYDDFLRNIEPSLRELTLGKKKTKTLDLNFNFNYNQIQFKENYILFSTINTNTTLTPSLHQEVYIKFENNDIVKNALHDFVETCHVEKLKTKYAGCPLADL